MSVQLCSLMKQHPTPEKWPKTGSNIGFIAQVKTVTGLKINFRASYIFGAFLGGAVLLHK